MNLAAHMAMVIHPRSKIDLDRVPTIQIATRRLANRGRYMQCRFGEPLPQKLGHPTVMAVEALEWVFNASVSSRSILHQVIPHPINHSLL